MARGSITLLVIQPHAGMLSLNALCKALLHPLVLHHLWRYNRNSMLSVDYAGVQDIVNEALISHLKEPQAV